MQAKAHTVTTSKYTIAKYMRLSIEDEKTESMSIPHQRLILEKHIGELDIPNPEVIEFVDNGHSGTNMERPAIQEMLDLARNGMIDCIAVKDFSRFSRNTMDSGYFIEQVFPLYQVRFISVADNYDSNDYKNDTGGIDVAFKFLMHEHYSADLSKKVRSAKRIQMARGENIVANAIYGYRKNADGKWEPDPEPAEIVHRIFKMALSGNSTAQIRDSLCSENIPTPNEYREITRGKDISPKCVWTARMVLHMLENEQYIGTYISGKQEQKAIGSHSKNWVDRSKWIMIPDSHPPIISKEDFTAVRDILSRYKSSTTAKPVNNLLMDDVDRPKRSRMISGEQIPTNVIYGYTRGADGKPVIDLSAAPVIQKMFDLAAKGLSIREIRDKLTENSYPTPSEHIKLSKGHDIVPRCQWTDKSVRNILQNIQYTGAYVSGKILKDYETGKKYHTAKSDWVIIHDMNPAIVGRELFEQAQKEIANNRKTQTRKKDYLLHGDIVKCGCCGYGLAYDGSIRDAVYRCHHTLADSEAKCHRLKVNAAELDNVVLAIIRKQAEVILNSGNLSEIRRTGVSGKQISDCEKEIEECVTRQQNNYENFILNEIDRETYLHLKNEYASRLAKLKRQIAVLRQTDRDNEVARKTALKARHVLNDETTPREVVETLIDKVFVYPNKKIDIRWKIADFTRG